MTIDQKLLHILRCPVTKQKLKLASDEEIKLLNTLIGKKALLHADESIIDEKQTDALVTENRQIIYKIINGIPVMLEDQSIPTFQIENW